MSAYLRISPSLALSIVRNMDQIVNSEDTKLSHDNTDGQSTRPGNTLPVFCNERTMSLNPLIHTNIIQSPYFKSLFELKTYHEVIDEIYNKVQHLEPWERGSRRPESGNRSVSVRGVAAGGIVSSAFCLLYKLFTLKLTRKQLHGLLKHQDSPYIRGLGFLYIRYTMPPGDFWEWLEPYLEDQEDVDLKAGGGQVMSIGEMCRHLLTKLDWFSTLFPRIPVPLQKEIEKHLQSYDAQHHPETNMPQQASPKNSKEHRRDVHATNEHGSRSDNGRHRFTTSETFRYQDSSSSNRYDDYRGHKNRDGTRDQTKGGRRRYDRDHDRDRDHSHRRSNDRHSSHRDDYRYGKRDHHRHQHRHNSRDHHHESSRSLTQERWYRSHQSRSRSPKRTEHY